MIRLVWTGLWRKPRKQEKKGEAKAEAGRGPKGSVGALLERKAAERQEQQRKKEEEKKRESRGRSRSRKRRRVRKKKINSSSEKRSDSDRSGSSESHKVFDSPLPGRRTNCGGPQSSRRRRRRRKLVEVQDDGVRELGGTASAAIGVRSHKELITLGTAIDMLIMGELSELGDLLMQRDQSGRQQLDDSSTPGVDTAAGRQLDLRERAEKGSKARSHQLEVEGADEKESDQQIANRRWEAGDKVSRDATSRSKGAVKGPRQGASGRVDEHPKEKAPERDGGEQRRVVLREAEEVRWQDWKQAKVRVSPVKKGQKPFHRSPIPMSEGDGKA